MAYTGPTVVNHAVLHINYAGPPTVDLILTCDLIAFELTPDTEVIDTGTFCEPAAQVPGRTTYTASLTALWSPSLVEKVQDIVGQQGVLAFSPDALNYPTHYIRFKTMINTIPWGRYELGQRVEVEIPIAVIDEPEWFDSTLPLAEAGAAPVTPPPVEFQQPAEQPAAA